MKKTMLVALIALLALAFAASLVSTAPSAIQPQRPNIQAITLTDAQKARISAPLQSNDG